MLTGYFLDVCACGGYFKKKSSQKIAKIVIDGYSRNIHTKQMAVICISVISFCDL